MKKIWIVLCVVAMLLVACGGDGGEQVPSPAAVPTTPAAETEQEQQEPQEQQQVPAQEQEQERITVRFAIFDWDQATYQDLIDAFEEANPDLRIQIVSANEVLGLGNITDLEFPDDANQRLVAAADVVDIEVSRQTVREGLVRDLTPLMEVDANFRSDDFFPGTLENYQWEGGTWALPVSLNIRLIYYDKDAFDEAGVPYPEPGWSWDDLLVKAQALTVGEGDNVTEWGFVVPTGLAYRMIESQVGRLADDSTDPPMPRFEEPDVIEAVRRYTNLYLQERVMPYSEPAEGEEGLSLSLEETLIDQGQAAMWPDFALLYWYRNQQGNVGVATFPANTADAKATPWWTEHWVMSAGTTQPQAAWRWMDYLSRQSVTSLGLGVKTLPSRRSAVATGGYWDDMDEELANTLRYALEHGYVAGETVGYDAFDEAMHAIWSGEKSVEDALADAQARAEAEIQEALMEETGATPVPTFVVAPPEKEAPVGEGATAITFIPGLGSLNLEPYRDLAAQFHEAHPDVVVEVKMADLLGGTVPDLSGMAAAADCFQWYPSFQQAANREAILNLEPFMDADPTFDSEDFFPATLEQFTYQGQVWGLPADVTPYIVEYNKDLFDAAGVDYPALDWNWEDFLGIAVDLTRGEGETKQYGFVPQVYELNDVLLILERLGAELLDESADPVAFSYNDPSTVEALRWYAGLSTEYEVKPVFLTDITKLAGITAMTLEREGLLNEGRAAMWTASGATAALFGDRGGLDIGAAPLPSRADGTSRGSLLTTSGYFISAETEGPRACWQWITFLTGQPAAVQGLPARRSVAESNEYRQQVGAGRADAYLATVADAEQPSAFEQFSEEEWLGGGIYWLGQAYSQVVEGKASPEEALDAAQKLADDYRACVIAAGDFGQETWQACAKEIDPTLPDLLFGTGG
jgi:multiple sugar transport system substrate-binding protein